VKGYPKLCDKLCRFVNAYLYKNTNMKFTFLFTCLLLVIGKLSAQKQDSLIKIDPNTKNIFTKRVNHTLVDQKLARLQITVKKLETTYNEAKALIDQLKNQKDSLSELNEQDMFFLQQLMEEKEQLESMISNIMKASSEIQNNIAKNLKAS
jgi:septal ring factor EnvC (AmiA/AmiB activator)